MPLVSSVGILFRHQLDDAVGEGKGFAASRASGNKMIAFFGVQRAIAVFLVD